MSQSKAIDALSGARSKLASRTVGPATIVVLVVGLAILWAVARPAEAPLGSYIGQLIGAESVLLMSIGLALISTLPWVEAWFNGIDRAAIWHRRVAITGLVLLAPHILLSSGRGSTLGGALAVGGLPGCWRSSCGRYCRAGGRWPRRPSARSSSRHAMRAASAASAGASAATSAGVRCTAPRASS